jgi:hypothetical protein
MSSFQSVKLWLVHAIGLPRDALHIYVGLAVLLAFAGAFRISLRDWRPIAAVLIVALAGEIWDLGDDFRSGHALGWLKSWHDIWNTMFWPLVLVALARTTRILKR